MTRPLVTLVALALVGCATDQSSKPAATGSPPAASQPAVAPPPVQPAPTPAQSAPTPAARAPAAAAPSAPAPSPATSAATPASRTVYVKTSLANFREGAGTSARILRVLRQGARLQLLETRNDWLRVRLDDGQEGWVAESVTSPAAP